MRSRHLEAFLTAWVREQQKARESGPSLFDV